MDMAMILGLALAGSVVMINGKQRHPMDRDFRGHRSSGMLHQRREHFAVDGYDIGQEYGQRDYYDGGRQSRSRDYDRY